MTNDEMRQRLAEAMGWTDLKAPHPHPLLGEDWTGIPPEGHRPSYRTELPDPLESDRDAAMLRAWCVGRGIEVYLDHAPNRAGMWIAGCSLARPNSLSKSRLLGMSNVLQQEEPDPCRRERLALCRAVLQVIEATEVQS
jgi:hypothetical protein